MMRHNRNNSDADPLPDWEVHLRDAFGQPGEPFGGVTGLAFTAEAALDAFFTFAP